MMQYTAIAGLTWIAAHTLQKCLPDHALAGWIYSQNAVIIGLRPSRWETWQPESCLILFSLSIGTKTQQSDEWR